MEKQVTITLANGVTIPQLGFGTFKVDDGQQVIDSVREALQVGYRHIDTAAVYGNEAGVGQGIKESGVPREEIFLTSKVWNSEQGYEATLAAFADTLAKLDTDYLDLYLIHWPKTTAKTAATWKAMEELYAAGKIRAIGVSNFKEHHLTALFETANVKPMVNQVELHPQLAQPELVAFCQAHEIAIEAWGPLMQGKIFEIDLFQTLATKYEKSIAQIAIRWHLQKGFIPMPKSITPSRIASNFDVFDFELSAEDMCAIDGLNTGERIGPDPDKIEF
ncbi:MAG: aldo/keto reductase [Culicoidibacterales bacterium]